MKAKPPHDQHPASAQRRVLVVDDDPRVRAAIRTLVAATPDLIEYAALSTAGAARALRAGDDGLRGDRVDVALVDVPRAQLRPALELVAGLSTMANVVAFSIDGSVRHEALRAGAQTFLSKDGDPDALLQALRHCGLADYGI